MAITDYPTYYAESFICPHCHVHSSMGWENKGFNDAGLGRWVPKNYLTIRLLIGHCKRCMNYTVWLEEKMIYPEPVNVPYPHKDMPDDVKQLYYEAASILTRSGRGACALIRLALEKVLAHLKKRTDSSLGYDISELAANYGLDREDMQSMHIIQLVGNDKLHWKELIETDTEEVARKLFAVLNYIVDSVYDKIAAKSAITEVYQNTVPATDRDRAEKRDDATRRKSQTPNDTNT